MTRTELVERIRRVRAEIESAETEVDGLLHLIAVVPGAEKVSISEAMADAFHKLRAAKLRLFDLDAVLVSNDKAPDAAQAPSPVVQESSQENSPENKTDQAQAVPQPQSEDAVTAKA